MDEEKNVQEVTETQEVDKHQKFLDTTQDLVRKAVVAIEKLGKASNERQFEYSDEEVEKVFGALQEALDDTKAMFKKRKAFEW